MKIKINEVDYDLYFGLGMIRELDNRYYSTSARGIKFGQGVEKAAIGALDGDPVILSDIIHAATAANQRRPSPHDVDQYLDSLDPDQLEAVFDEVRSELKKGNTTGPRIMTLEETIKAMNSPVQQLVEPKEMLVEPKEMPVKYTKKS